MPIANQLAADLSSYFTRYRDTLLATTLASALASRRLVLAFFARPVDPLDRINADSLPRATPVAVPVTARAVREMSHSERIEAALGRVPAHLKGPLRDAFLGLISPTSIVITVSTFAGLALAQLAGYGEIADAALAAIAYEIAGLSGVRALYDMVAGTVNAAMATSEADIDAAAVRLAGAFVTLGMAFLAFFVTRAARKAAQAREAASREQPHGSNPETAPSEEAAPRTVMPSMRALPDADKAVIDNRKIVDYALNPDHPVGANKARVFQSALGYNRDNAGGLISQIKDGVQTSPATLGRIDQFGTRYTVDIPVTGPSGSATVRTGWIVDSPGALPRLTTAYVE